MSLLKKILGQKETKSKSVLRVTYENLALWPKTEKLYNERKIRIDSNGRFRYLHGAPVGDMILIRINKDGVKVYKESAEEWFDPESQKAKDFIWP